MLDQLVAADREVDAAEEAVAVAGREHGVAVVAEPAGPVEVALVAVRRRPSGSAPFGLKAAMLPSRLIFLPTVVRRGRRGGEARRPPCAGRGPACGPRARTAGSRPRAPASPTRRASRVEALSSSRLRANGRRSSNAGPRTAARRGGRVRASRVACSSVPGSRLTARCTFGSCSAIAPSAPLEAETSSVRSLLGLRRPGVVSRLKLWISRARFSLRCGDLAVELGEVAVDRPESSRAACRAPCRGPSRPSPAPTISSRR